ncbi:MAG: hypothetical protein K2Y05_04005 [Hyphomicrobiaceae bacterium]|nr:hypothetical protein [Hyphomicrobiaceae bacterium]
MSLRAIPLIALAFILYNVLVLTGGPAILDKQLFTLRMVSGGDWTFKVADLVILLTMTLLFIEILKSTLTSTSSLVDHGLSMLVLMAVLVEFLVVKQAATSVFFFILVACVVDVIAGFTIGIRVAKRDIGFSPGGGE